MTLRRRRGPPTCTAGDQADAILPRVHCGGQSSVLWGLAAFMLALCYYLPEVKRSVAGGDSGLPSDDSERRFYFNDRSMDRRARRGRMLARRPTPPRVSTIHHSRTVRNVVRGTVGCYARLMLHCRGFAELPSGTVAWRVNLMCNPYIFLPCFGFATGACSWLAFRIETRRESGRRYSPQQASLRCFGPACMRRRCVHDARISRIWLQKQRLYEAQHRAADRTERSRQCSCSGSLASERCADAGTCMAAAPHYLAALSG